jgi:hypothetical protein
MPQDVANFKQAIIEFSTCGNKQKIADAREQSTGLGSELSNAASG